MYQGTCAPPWCNEVECLASLRFDACAVKQKSRSVAHLQPAQPFEVVSWAIRMTETYFVLSSIRSAGAKVFDVYRNEKRDFLVLSTGCAIPADCSQFSKSAKRSSQPFNDRAITFAACAVERQLLSMVEPIHPKGTPGDPDDR